MQLGACPSLRFRTPLKTPILTVQLDKGLARSAIAAIILFLQYKNKTLYRFLRWEDLIQQYPYLFLNHILVFYSISCVIVTVINVSLQLAGGKTVMSAEDTLHINSLPDKALKTAIKWEEGFPAYKFNEMGGQAWSGGEQTRCRLWNGVHSNLTSVQAPAT